MYKNPTLFNNKNQGNRNNHSYNANNHLSSNDFSDEKQNKMKDSDSFNEDDYNVGQEFSGIKGKNKRAIGRSNSFDED